MALRLPPRRPRKPITTGRPTAPRISKTARRGRVNPTTRINRPASPTAQTPGGSSVVAGASTPPSASAPVGNAPPPQTVQGLNTRISGATNYGLAENDLKNQIWNAAFRYGDQAMMQQYGGRTLNNENSQLAQIQRNLLSGQKAVADRRLGENTFFSGGHQSDRSELDSQAARERQAAYEEFRQAQIEFNSGIARAQAERDEAERNARATDLEAAMAAPPQPTGPAEPAGPLTGAQILANFQANQGPLVIGRRRYVRGPNGELRPL